LHGQGSGHRGPILIAHTKYLPSLFNQTFDGNVQPPPPLLGPSITNPDTRSPNKLLILTHSPTTLTCADWALMCVRPAVPLALGANRPILTHT
jgi:hypothetical protein